MRVPLYKEGVPTTDGRTLLDTTWRGPDPLPVLMSGASLTDGHEGSFVIGQLVDIAKEGEWVMGTILLATLDPPDVYDYAVEADFITQPGESMTDGVMRGAILAAVTLGQQPVWEGMWIREWVLPDATPDHASDQPTDERSEEADE